MLGTRESCVGRLGEVHTDINVTRESHVANNADDDGEVQRRYIAIKNTFLYSVTLCL